MELMTFVTFLQYRFGNKFSAVDDLRVLERAASFIDREAFNLFHDRLTRDYVTEHDMNTIK